jgi:hypothetical protein
LILSSLSYIAPSLIFRSSNPSISDCDPSSRATFHPAFDPATIDGDGRTSRAVRVLASVDLSDFAALIFLDLSAAFSTVDHGILLVRLRFYGGRFRLRTAHTLGCLLTSPAVIAVRHGGPTSHSTALECGVPRGSVLGPILFVLYTADLQAIVERHELSPHFYADDSQICGFCRPGDVETLSQRLVDCIDDVMLWIRSNRLQLDVNKTDQHWCTTSRRLSHAVLCRSTHVRRLRRRAIAISVEPPL